MSVFVFLIKGHNNLVGFHSPVPAYMLLTPKNRKLALPFGQSVVLKQTVSLSVPYKCYKNDATYQGCVTRSLYYLPQTIEFFSGAKVDSGFAKR